MDDSYSNTRSYSSVRASYPAPPSSILGVPKNLVILDVADINSNLECLFYFDKLSLICLGS